MAKTATILGPYTQEQVNSKTAIQTAIVSALGANTPISADPFIMRGSFYVLVTTN